MTGHQPRDRQLSIFALQVELWQGTKKNNNDDNNNNFDQKTPLLKKK